MSRNRLTIIGAVIVIFVAVGAIIAFRSAGGGGQARTFNLTVAGSKMTPDKIEAKSGDTITINMTKDQDGEVHLHGYDLHFEAKAGEKDTKTFKADKTGSFDMEIEDSSTPVGSFTVTSG